MPNADHTLISVADFRAALRAKRTPSGGVFRISTEPSIPVGGDESRVRRFIFSDARVDLMGDSVAVDGWETDDFENNPVALWAHDSSQPPIGQASNVGVEGKQLKGDIEFASPEDYPFADTIFRLVKGRFIRAVSVGFMPLEYTFVENNPDRSWGIDFKRQTLLEISVCPVPANPNALQEARRKGIDIRPLFQWAEQMLDTPGSEKIIISRAELETLRKQAKEKPMAARPKNRPAPRQRAADEDPEDKTGKDAAPEGNCGRDKDETCGMKDPEECQVHCAEANPEDPVDPNDEKALVSALKKLRGPKYREPDDNNGAREDNGNDAPVAHEDAIRLAHKHLRTSKSYLGEATAFHGKAVDLLGSVVDALNADDGGAGGEGDPKSDETNDEPDDKEKAAQLRRAEERKARLKVV